MLPFDYASNKPIYVTQKTMGGIEFKVRKTQFVILSQIKTFLGTSRLASLKGTCRAISKYLCANIQ